MKKRDTQTGATFLPETALVVQETDRLPWTDQAAGHKALEIWFTDPREASIVAGVIALAVGRKTGDGIKVQLAKYIHRRHVPPHNWLYSSKYRTDRTGRHWIDFELHNMLKGWQDNVRGYFMHRGRRYEIHGYEGPVVFCIWVAAALARSEVEVYEKLKELVRSGQAPEPRFGWPPPVHPGDV